MGVERRKGNLYYYRKRRDGSRVVSEYVGGGELADLADFRAEQLRLERQRLRLAAMSMAEIDAEVDGVGVLIDALAKASLVRAGYHQHKREWRRRRGGGKS